MVCKVPRKTPPSLLAEVDEPFSDYLPDTLFPPTHVMPGTEDDQEQTAAYLQWPAHVPPSETRSSYGVNSSLQPYNILCQTICLTLVTGLILLRIYTKGRVLKILGLDDCKYPTACTTNN